MKHHWNLILFVLIYLFIFSTIVVLIVIALYLLFFIIKYICEKIFKLLFQNWESDGRSLTPVDDSPIYIYDIAANYARPTKKKRENEDILKNLPVPAPYKRSLDDKTIVSCVICLEDMEEGELCWCLPQCNHVFHEPCVKPWLITKKNCPICRLSLLV
ncbi:hypothetical protein M9H77_10077 [Catharanthus roseus]|uniref:Uncharacterized protein n=1 Tax=Catharanthus roseus TaxID=4058 RepID=A0ACC0C2K5_CATRO|nr:hypothetical protein M9H77_10077 [Catharanthus roseus]